MGASGQDVEPATQSRTGGPAAELLDVVDTWEQASRLPSPPLVVREGLQRVLDLDDRLDVRRIDAGHSNPTFLVQAHESRWILRRPPRPPFEPKAHDVLREHRFLTALRDQPVRAPVPVLACRNPAVIGAPFYLMEALEGLVLRDRVPPPLDTPAERERVAEQLVDSLVELHAVDPAAVGLGDAARGAGYLTRQIELWSGQWKRNQTRDVPALDEVTHRLRNDIPTSPRIAIVHGDYKLDNVLFASETPARLIAILDWEMAAVGDPLADLGYLTATWIDPGESPDRVAGLSAATSEPGFLHRQELADRYATRSGLSLNRLAWYQALALWKLAILLEASYSRYLAGTTADEFFRKLKEDVPRIAGHALDASAGSLL